MNAFLNYISILLLSYMVAINGQKPYTDGCADLKTPMKCDFWKRHGSCITHQKRMMLLCPKTCNLCEDKKVCQNFPCSYPKFCRVNSLGKPYCACSLDCKLKALKKRLGSVCGTDGRTYINICKMQFTACEQGRSIAVKNFGQCAIDGPCEDKQSKELCLGWQKAGACKVYVPLMKRYCTKTCGMCEKRAAAPVPNCKNTVYGCCPDNITTALGPNGKGCSLECEDKYRFCRSFTIDCVSKVESNKKFMRKHCRKSCGYCTTEG